MLLPLGILAASGAATVGSYELITSTVLTSTATSVNFTSLGTAAAAYKHLQIRYVTKSGTGTGAAGDMRFNNDSGFNYRTHILSGNGSSVVGGDYGGGSTAAQAVVDIMDFSPSTSNGWTVGIIDILDWQGNKNKTVRRLGGRVASDISITTIELLSSVWMSTAAITDISLYARSQNLAVGSRFSLYGLRG